MQNEVQTVQYGAFVGQVNHAHQPPSVSLTPCLAQSHQASFTNPTHFHSNNNLFHANFRLSCHCTYS